MTHCLVLILLLGSVSASAAESQAPAAPRPDSDLALLGAGLMESDRSLAVAQILPGSMAEELALKPGDRLLYLDRLAVRTATSAAAAFSGWIPRTRLSAVARRGLEVLVLEGRDPEPQPGFSRGPGDLSAYEALFKDARLKNAAREASASLAKPPSLDFTINARQAFWLSFPEGVREDAGVGDVLEGELTSAVSASPELDFLCLPPKSQVWAKVLESSGSEETRRLRLFLFRMRPAGGHYYPIAGRVTDVLGDQKLARVSSGGTLVLAMPAPSEGRRRQALGPDMRLRAELIEPLTLTEPPQFYRAGAGLWIRTRGEGRERRLEISAVIPGRAADHAGLRAGQVLTSINGKNASKLDFGEALSELYDSPAKTLKLSVIREPGGSSESLLLFRAVSYKEGKFAAIAPPVPKAP